jgi:hypothetical protein
MEAYPASTLIDIYKSFFQDEYGPGHMLGDTGGAREYFEYELNEMKSQGRYVAEPCGIGRQFVRAPMDLVRDSLVSEDAYFQAFLESAKSFSVPDPHQWKRQWGDIVRVIESMNLALPNFKTDIKHLEELLNQGDPVVHHSQAYSDAYDPHYRIMTVKKWQELAK